MAYIDYLQDYGGYWLYLGDKERGPDDWYPARPGSFYSVLSSYHYPDTWEWVNFTPDCVTTDEYGDITYKAFGSVSQVGDEKFVSYMDSNVYDGVRLEDIAQIDLDSEEEEEQELYQGFGSYTHVDLGIDESLLGERSYGWNWDDDQADQSNGSNMMRNHVAVCLAAAVV